MNERPSERTIVFCVGAVQFVNILDFVIVMPLGPDFAKALGIPLSHLGYVGGSYTAAASVSGLAGAFFLDRFDRRKALAVAMLGLVIGTLSGAFATGLATLMLARVVAGAFGGPATSLSYSIIADVIPPARRGKAMGAVMGAFAVASVLGVPAGLELARRGSWKLPFVAVAVLGALLGTYAHAALPAMIGHLVAARSPRSRLRELLDLVRPDLALSLLMTFVVMAAGFILSRTSRRTCSTTSTTRASASASSTSPAGWSASSPRGSSACSSIAGDRRASARSARSSSRSSSTWGSSASRSRCR